jgi:hypothetical protein
MGSVEWANATEVTIGSPPGNGGGRWWLRRMPARLAQWLNGLSDLRARRVAAGMFVVAFVLLVVSQWKPWFQIDKAGGITFRDLPSGLSDIDALTALNTLVVPYFACWTVIAMLCGAAVFGRKRMRRGAAGVAGGALAAQALILLAAWHSRGIEKYSPTVAIGTPHASRRAGIYLAFAALLVTAAALAVVLRGRIFPTSDDDDDPYVSAAARVGGAAGSGGSTGAAVFGEAGTGSAEGYDEPHTPAPRRGVRAGMPWVDGGEALDEPAAVANGYGNGRHESARLNGHRSTDHDAAAEESQNSPRRAGTPDHSMYMRPRDANVN